MLSGGGVKRPARRRLRDSMLASIVTVGASPIHGRGLFAVRPIHRGEYIGTFDGPVAERDGRHVLWIYPEDEGEPVGRRGANSLRFLNHSKAYNAEFHGFDLYATRDIASGAELTIDYGH